MRLRRFLVDDLSPPLVHLTGRESRHAIQVLRLKVGDSVVLFDGRGLEATGIVREVGRLTMAVEISERRAAPPRTLVSLTLAVATPKGERADWLVEKCAELGVTALWLLETERSQVRPGEGKLERWRRKALQAAKQAGHASIMTVEAHRPFDEVLTSRDRFRILYGEPRASVSLGWTTG